MNTTHTTPHNTHTITHNRLPPPPTGNRRQQRPEKGRDSNGIQENRQHSNYREEVEASEGRRK